MVLGLHLTKITGNFMKLFIGGEMGPWPKELDDLISKQRLTIQHNTVKPLEKFLLEKNYGPGLKDLGIIMMILHPDYQLYKERTLYRAKESSADYRLKIDYDAFVSADEAGKRRLMIENILQCVRLLGIKTKKQKTKFDAERLEKDIIEFTGYKNE